jgi:uncharacterized protein (TIGR02145 family)
MYNEKKPSSLLLFLLLVICAILIESCSSTGAVTDIDGNEYKTVKLGSQWWMAENLRVTRYRNGVEIPNVTDGEEWSSLSSSAYCSYQNDNAEVETYGLLYNWYTVDDPNGLCPTGWHVPSDDEWKELERYLGMSQREVDSKGWRGTDEGGKLKEEGTNHWQNPNSGATNETGLTVVPSGSRASDLLYGGQFFYRGTREGIWSSSERTNSLGIFREFWNDKSEIGYKFYSKRNGFTVRCIMD